MHVGRQAMATGVLYAGAGLAVVSSAACAGVVALLWAAMFAFVSVGAKRRPVSWLLRRTAAVHGTVFDTHPFLNARVLLWLVNVVMRPGQDSRRN